jgi:hypothetical protein
VRAIRRYEYGSGQRHDHANADDIVPSRSSGPRSGTRTSEDRLIALLKERRLTCEQLSSMRARGRTSTMPSTRAKTPARDSPEQVDSDRTGQLCVTHHASNH